MNTQPTEEQRMSRCRSRVKAVLRDIAALNAQLLADGEEEDWTDYLEQLTADAEAEAQASADLALRVEA
jgi:hypothetical protein